MAWDDAPPSAGPAPASQSWDQAPPPEAPYTSVGDSVQKAAEVAGKALDYQRGAVSPVLSAIAQAMGRPGMTPEEYKAALSPTTTQRAPGAQKMLGIPSGPPLSSVLPLFQPKGASAQDSWYNPMKYWPERGGMLDVTPGGVAGGAIDMLTDPLTYETAGIGKAAKVLGEEAPAWMKAFTAPSAALEAIGKKTYASGIQPLINKASQYGKKDVADTYFKNGIWGRSSTIANMGDAAADSLSSKAQQLRGDAQAALDARKSPNFSSDVPQSVAGIPEEAQAAQQIGAKSQRAYQPYIDEVNKMMSSGDISPDKGQKLLDEIAYRLQIKNPSLEQMSRWKTLASQDAGNAAYDVTKNPSLAKRLSKAEAGGLAQEVERGTEEGIPGAGQQLHETNDELGKFLTVQNVADKQAAREANRKLLSAQDFGHGSLGSAITGDPVTALKIMAARRIPSIINAVPVRTGLGYGMQKAAQGVFTGPAINAATIDTLKNMANPNQPVAGVGR